jgi:hypothetical protein
MLLSLKGRATVGMDVGYDEIITASNIQFRMIGTHDLQKMAGVQGLACISRME